MKLQTCVLFFVVGAFLSGQTAGSITELSAAGSAAFGRGDWADADRWFTKAARESDRHPPGPMVRSSVDFNLAAVSRALARFETANALYRKSLMLREEAVGTDSATLIPILRGLAATLLATGNFDEAERQVQRALALAEVGGGDSEWGRTLGDLARIQMALGRETDAESTGRLALRKLDPRERGYAEVLTTLGVLARQQGRVDDAERCAEEAGSVLSRTLGDRHPFTAAAWNNLAEVKIARGNLKEGERLLIRATRTWEAALGRDHPDVAIGLTNLGQAALQQRHLKQAEPLFRRSLAIDRQSFGERSARVAMDWNNLGTLAIARRKFREAASNYERALETSVAANGPEHSDTALVAGNLGIAYCRLKRWDAAAPLLKQAVLAHRVKDAMGSRQLAMLLEWQAHGLRNRQDFSEAARVDSEAMRIRVKLALRQ